MRSSSKLDDCTRKNIHHREWYGYEIWQFCSVFQLMLMTADLYLHSWIRKKRGSVVLAFLDFSCFAKTVSAWKASCHEKNIRKHVYVDSYDSKSFYCFILSVVKLAAIEMIHQVYFDGTVGFFMFSLLLNLFRIDFCSEFGRGQRKAFRSFEQERFGISTRGVNI